MSNHEMRNGNRGKKYLEINKVDGVGVELVLPQSRTPAVEKKKKYFKRIQLVLPHSRTPAVGKMKKIFKGYRTSAPAVPHSRSRKQKKI